MGSVFQKNGKWYIKYKELTGGFVAHPTKVETKRAAQALCREKEVQIERQRLGLEARPSDLKSMFADLCVWWLEERCDPDAKGIEESRLNKHVVNTKLGALPLIAVTAGAVNEHFIKLERDPDDGLAPASINRLRAILHSIFEQASNSEPKRWIGPNPIAAVPLRDVPQRIYETLHAEQVPVLLPHVNSDWRDVFAAALFLALRKGELCGLLKTDIHLPSREIKVWHSYGKETTKGGHGDVLPIAEPLVPYLEHALDVYPGPYLFPWPDGSMRTKESDPHKVLRTAMKRAGFVTGYDHVCRRCAAAGKPHVEHHQDRELRRCPSCDMKLWPRALQPTIRFHDLRHTTATLLLRAGVDVHRVQRILRHADINTTINTYGHLVVEDLRGSVATLPSVPSIPTVTEDFGASLVRAPENSREEDPNPPLTTEDPGLLLDGRSRVRTCDPCRVKANRGSNQISTNVPKPSQPFRNVVVAVSQPSTNIPPETDRFGASLVLRGQGPNVLASAAGLTVAQVAWHLQVSTALIYQLIDRGELGHVRVSNAIRIPADQLQAYLARPR